MSTYTKGVYVTAFNKFRNEMQERQQKLNAELSLCDQQISDLEHYLELTKCSGADMVKIAKQIKIIKIRRRNVKNELEEVTHVGAKMTNECKALKSPTHYNYRTDIVQTILKKE
jgi:hypothetical protein